MRYSKPSVRERGKGRWQVRIRFRDGDGWGTYACSVEATSRRAAEREADGIRQRLEVEAELGPAHPMGPGDDAALVKNYLARYIDGLEGSGQIEATTAAGYRSSAKHISRYLGKVRMDEVTGDMVLDMQRRLLEGDELCADTVAKDHRLLKQAMSHAVEVGEVASSPFTRSIRAPKRRHREPNSLDDAGRRRLLGALDSMADTNLTIGVRLALSCGMRREEVCGLRWRDVDLEGGLVQVRNVVTEAGGRVVEKGPKSETSRRDIPLEPDLLARLGRLHARAVDECGRAAAAGRYVLEGPKNGHLTPSLLGKEFSSLARQYDLVGTAGERVTFHDLRHTYATYLIARRVDVKTVAGLMGHADATVTLNVYASADPEARRQAADVVAQAMSERDPVEGS